MTVLAYLTDIELRGESIIHYLIGALPILRDLLHLLQLLRTGVGLREDHAHLIPALPQLLVAHLVLYRKLLEVFVEFLGLPLEVPLGVLCQLAEEEGVAGLVLLDLEGVLGQHDLEGLGAFVDGGLGDILDLLLLDLPLVGIVQQEDLLLPDV